MGSLAKSLALLFIACCIVSTVTFQRTIAITQSSNNVSSPAIVWQQTIKTGDTETVSNIVQTNDGGYAFLDPGWGHQGFRVSTFYKLDSSGNVQWKQHNSSIWANSFVPTNNGEFELFGSWISPDYGMFGTGKSTPAVFLMNPNGDLRSTVNSSNYGGSPLPTSDGGFIISNNYPQNGNLTKINALGGKQWSSIIKEPANQSEIAEVIRTNDGGYALVGSTSFNGTADTPNLYIWLAKVSSNGTLLWSRQFGQGPTTVDTNQTQNAGALDELNRRTLGDNEGISVIETPDGGFVATGIVYPLRNYSWWGFSMNRILTWHKLF